MDPTTRRRAIAAGIGAALVVIAGIAIYTTRNENGPVLERTPSAYAPLGSKLAPLAEVLKLAGSKVDSVTYGREIASGFGPISGSDDDGLRVSVVRTTDKRGQQTIVLEVELSRFTGSDAILLPWSVTKVVPNDAFEFSPDFSDVRVSVPVCDERTGRTDTLVVRWTMKAEPLDFKRVGKLLDGRGGDAMVTGRFGEQRFSSREGSLAIQMWANEPRVPDLAQRFDGKRQKEIKCASR